MCMCVHFPSVRPTTFELLSAYRSSKNLMHSFIFHLNIAVPIRMFNVMTGKMVCEVTAHSGWITGMDLASR